MTANVTKAFMALCSIAQHFGRPGVPTDQAPIESFFGHVKGDWPHVESISPSRRRHCWIVLSSTATFAESSPGSALCAGPAEPLGSEALDVETDLVLSRADPPSTWSRTIAGVIQERVASDDDVGNSRGLLSG